MKRLSLFFTLSVLLLAFPLVTGEWPNTHESQRFPALAQHYQQLLGQGEVLPRWLYDSANGYGYPTFLFYQPLLYLITVPAVWLLGDYRGLAVTYVLVFTGAAEAIYRLGRRWFSEPAAISGGLLFLLSPYLSLNLWVRGAFPETLAMMVFPWVLVGIAAIYDRGWVAVAPTALATTLLICAHPLLTVLAGPVAAVFGLWMAARHARPTWFVGLCAVAAVGGLLMSLPYTWPAFTLRDAVQLDIAFDGIWYTPRHVLWPQQLVQLDWGYGISRPGPDDTMVFTLGLGHVLCALGGLWFGRDEPAIRLAAGLTLACVVVMMPFMGFFWALPPFVWVQFPWRLIAVLMVPVVLLAMGLDRWSFLQERPMWWGALVMLAVFSAPQRLLPLGRPVEDRLPVSATLQAYDEFLPRTASHPPTPRETLVEGADVVSTLPIRAEATGPRRVTVQQFGFPGWSVTLDGAAVDVVLDDHGRMQVEVPQGPHTIEAVYDGPPGWRGRAGLAWLTGLCLLVLSWVRRDAG